MECSIPTNYSPFGVMSEQILELLIILTLFTLEQ